MIRAELSAKATPARIVAGATWFVDRAAAGRVLELDAADRPEVRTEEGG